MAGIKAYNSKENRVVVNAVHTITGLTEDDAIKISFNSPDIYKHVTDVQGNVHFAASNNSLAILELTMLQTSASMQYLTDLYNMHLADPNFSFPTSLSSYTGDVVFGATECVIPKAPEVTYVQEISKVTWTIYCTNFNFKTF